MRQTFQVVAKIIGLFLLYGTVAQVIGMGQWVLAWYNQRSSTHAIEILGFPVSFLVFFGLIVLSGVMAWMLLMRTDWIADRLNVDVTSGKDEDVQNRRPMLHVGIKLLGLYLIAQSFPLVATLLGIFGSNLVTQSWQQMVSPVLSVGFGLALLLGTESVVTLIDKEA